MKLIFLLFISVLAKLHLPFRALKHQPGTGYDLPRSIISSYNNISYTAQVSIGTPGQQFNLLLDTMSSNLWIVNDICKSCIKPSNVFVPTESSTFIPTVDRVQLEPQYGSAEALICKDSIEISEIYGDSQTFELVFEDLSYEGDYWDGVLGLGFNSSSNWLYTLYNQSVIENPAFSLYFSKDDDQESQLILGGMDYTLADNAAGIQGGELPDGVTNWAFDLPQVDIESVSIKTNTLVEFDLTSPFILAPYKDLYHIYNIFTDRYNCQTGPQITCSCEDIDEYPNITFIVHKDSHVSLRPQGYLQYNSSIGECVLLFEESETENWVLGTSFLRQFYTSFWLPNKSAKPSIWIALPRHNHKSHSSDSTDDFLGLKIGLPIGGVVALGAVGAICCWCVIKRRKAKKAKNTQENQQRLIVYVAPNPSDERAHEEPRLSVNADGAHTEVRPIVVINEPDKNVQTVLYPFLPPVGDS